MWLINTKTLKLEYFMNPESVSYAILSHTWDVGEVSFQGFSHPILARREKGYTKIKKTCQLARDKHGLEYAWVDTCCIDKTSSAELSEAINSMYRWYQGAAVCFVYLSDMSLRLVQPKSGTSMNGVEEVLRGCKWFTRGWTLQELLAPRDIEFYNRDWFFIDTKISWLLDPLSRITGIEPMFLGSAAMVRTASVGTRMWWASKRQTTRPEDTAYCLLGIFDINMPMLYGEGSGAFLRLQEEICKQTNDLSLFAWTAQPGHMNSSSEKYRGIFAMHPCEFAGFRRLEYQSSGRFRGELAITNKGLRLDDIQLHKTPKRRLFLPLDCYIRGSRQVSYGILLALTLDGYIRREPKVLAKLPVEHTSDIPTHRIYIQKRLPPQWLGRKRLWSQYNNAIWFRFHQPSKITIMHVVPQESFDYTNMAFLTGGKKFFGYLRVRVSDIELVIICWFGSLDREGISILTPSYTYALEGDGGWDIFKIRRLEAEITNHAVQDETIPSLLPTPKLNSSHRRAIVHSSGMYMLIESLETLGRYNILVAFGEELIDRMTSRTRSEEKGLNRLIYDNIDGSTDEYTEYTDDSADESANESTDKPRREPKNEPTDPKSNDGNFASNGVSFHLPFISTTDPSTGRRSAFSA
ncbi:heterokaryon incompatibility protein-domain-containing protein [Hypoxylon trugodes]|uniref:heterokaryon incompatibility protein-domain-containing protein n=1 Tax=Hypoxylon trugodes TaxID=326681 RepID=UPI00219C9959|nr:heterokaryon incompatibility protein-domain-containing protein [Hypoxylon trugodes]KAI1384127.1 heterokaryon incompatibility protein-domain-containing protein [Hypoxylon trugodes]